MILQMHLYIEDEWIGRGPFFLVVNKFRSGLSDLFFSKNVRGGISSNIQSKCRISEAGNVNTPFSKKKNTKTKS